MRAICVFLFGAVVMAAGCGGAGGVTANGKVVKGGAPFAVPAGETVAITLTADDGKTTYNTFAAADGTFTVQKPSGAPIPAGKYKVSYVHSATPDPYTKKAGFKFAKDVPEGWDLTTSTPLTIDLGTK